MLYFLKFVKLCVAYIAYIAYIAFGLLGMANTGRAHPLTLETNVVHEPEMGKVSRLLIRCGSQAFSVVPPRAWRAETKTGEDTVQLISPDHALTLRIIFSTNQLGALPASPRSILQKILPEVADAELVEEFPAYGGDRHGKGVELLLVVQEHRMRCRAATLPVNGGTAIFVITGGSVDFDPARRAFGEIVTSFRHQPRAENDR